MRREPAPIAAEICATLAIAAPLAGANLAQMAMQVTDTVMVGHLGADALAAAGLGGGLYWMLLLICQGVLTAVAPLAAHALGADDRVAAGRLAGAGLVLAAVFAIPVMTLLAVLPRFFAALGYAPDLVAEIARFLQTVLWGVPAALGVATLRFVLVAAFRTRVVMVVPLIAVPLNALAGWMLIFGHCGAPMLGIVGAGCAIAAMQWLMLLCLAGYMTLTRRRVPLGIAVRFWRDIARIVRLGGPIGGQAALEAGLFVATGIMMGVLGADALGAHQLALNVVGVTFMVPLGLGQAVTVRVAFRLGSGAPAAARDAAFVALALGATFMTATAVLLWIAPRMLAGLYINLADPANRGLLAIALHLFMIAAIFQVFDGTQVIATGALRGYHDTAAPMAIAAVGYWVIGFTGGWLLAFPLGLGATGLWSGLALGLATVAIALTVRLCWRARASLRGLAPAAALAAG
ncbi:MAG TPA: MATE family efflux transporter [Stellaceae bacterium]|nr:MATE family efflux transporter [Stellaceae bacterium]